MRILSITAQKPHSTGSGTYLTELVRAWDRMGHSQAVVCGLYYDDTTDFPADVSVFPVIYSKSGQSACGISERTVCADARTDESRKAPALPFPMLGMSDVMPYESTQYSKLTDEMVSRFEEAFIAAVSQAVEALDPDLIVCHHLFLLTALVRKHFPERKICGISHGTDLRQMVNCDNLRHFIAPQITRLDRIFALHNDQRTQIIQLFGIRDESSVSVIGSGYNSRLFNREGRTERAPGEPVRICYAGKMCSPKGVPELLAALAEINGDSAAAVSCGAAPSSERTEEHAGRRPPFTASLAGGCREAAVQSLLDDLPANIRYLGQISQSELAAVFKSSDIFVLPSYFEGLALVLIEAMACGLITVSTDLPGEKDWISANVGNPSIIYVPMPEMASLDEPTAAGKAAHTIALRDALLCAIQTVESGGSEPSDTGRISWDAVSAGLIAD